MLYKSSSHSLVAIIPSVKPWSTGMLEPMLKRYSWSKVRSNGSRNSLPRTFLLLLLYVLMDECTCNLLCVSLCQPFDTELACSQLGKGGSESI